MAYKLRKSKGDIMKFFDSEFDLFAQKHKLYIDIAYHTDDNALVWVHHIIKWRDITILDRTLNYPLTEDQLLDVCRCWFRDFKIDNLLKNK